MTQMEVAIAASELVRLLESYLAEHPAAALIEDGRVLFDLRIARYSIREQHGRCLLQFWSEERNLMRSVLDVQPRAQSLRIATRRMGASKPQFLELVPSTDRRTPTLRQTQRRNYQRLVERVLTRSFPYKKINKLSSAMDLENSFGPAYIRGLLVQGMDADAIIAVGSTESFPMLDGILTLGILWLDHCRRHTDSRRHVRGLKIIVPPDAWQRTAERIAWLNPLLARFELYTLDEHSEELTPIDLQNIGNLASRMAHAFPPDAILERCGSGLQRILSLIPAADRECIEIRPNSATETSISLHGLDFARIRSTTAAGSFTLQNDVTFGAGVYETPLSEETESLCSELLLRLFQDRRPDGSSSNPLFRLQPERWLESAVRQNIMDIFPDLRADLFYAQVPAFAARERGMLDLLTLDRDNRLTVLEFKVSEDLHLPLQTLDYWMRVHALHLDRQPLADSPHPRSTFERMGYFPRTEISPLPPRMILVTPALHLHPANEIVLRHISPKVEWELVGITEHWRHKPKVIFRKRSEGNQRV